ncbi:lipopolysaccharide transport periplasmic protein LptA [Sulfurimonas sp.]|uniref:lipopolysaccharide transport periplasmic protein LptA n=1 Tax=Sulfurimonas sp. TaxID=2022749 RepID=UPI002AB1F151|nr:lipopolysaccharide transport periplasmic protein LptA [Sulfurimonas sp.]
MNKYLISLMLFLTVSLNAQELKIKANQFNADENKGISIFQGNVNIIKGLDELNATKVTVFTNKKHQPTKFIAIGNVSFVITTKTGSLYRGKAGRAIYMPLIKEYHFFKNVHLKQVDEKKEIIGDEVVLKTIEGKAYAKGARKKPVIMIFKMAPEKEEQK